MCPPISAAYARLVTAFRKRPATLLRRVTQGVVIALLVLAAWQFQAYITAIRTEQFAAVPHRPPLVEGFLPIAGIVAFRGLLATGVFDTVHPAGLVLLLVTLATAWLFRRALCGWVCPIGALSEGLAAAGDRLLKRRLRVPVWADRTLLVLKFALCAFAFKVFFLMPAPQAVAFLRTPYYAVSDVKMFDLFANLGGVGLTVLGALFLLSVLIRSFWCRYLCPYGALLGVLGVLGPVLLRRDAKTCINCHKCDRVCPNGVGVEGSRGLVISTECTGCTRCVEACPVSGALQFRALGAVRVRPLALALTFLVLFFGAIGWAKGSGRWESSLTPRQVQRYDAMLSAPRPGR